MAVISEIGLHSAAKDIFQSFVKIFEQFKFLSLLVCLTDPRNPTLIKAEMLVNFAKQPSIIDSMFTFSLTSFIKIHNV